MAAADVINVMHSGCAAEFQQLLMHLEGEMIQTILKEEVVLPSSCILRALYKTWLYIAMARIPNTCIAIPVISQNMFVALLGRLNANDLASDGDLNSLSNFKMLF